MVVVAILALLASLPNAFAQSKAVLKSYNCPVDRIDAAADQIRTTFSKVPELRVAVDKRSGQILVHAPADVHAQITAGLNQLALQPAQAAPSAAGSSAPAAPNAEQNVPTATNILLQNLSAQDFDAKLRGILKNRLAPLASQTPGTNRYQLTAARGDGVEVGIDLANNQVALRGPAQGVLGASRLVHAMDAVGTAPQDNIRLIAYQAAKPENMQKAVDAVRMAENGRGNDATKVARLVPNQIEGSFSTAQASPSPQQPNENEGRPKPEGEKEGESTGLSGSVQVELLEGLDVIVIRGKKKDIEQVSSIIEQIEKLSTQTEPSIEIYPLTNVYCELMATLVRDL
jgi:type II secretory pathway component GspD/PulD (secretin)